MPPHTPQQPSRLLDAARVHLLLDGAGSDEAVHLDLPPLREAAHAADRLRVVRARFVSLVPKVSDRLVIEQGIDLRRRAPSTA